MCLENRITSDIRYPKLLAPSIPSQRPGVLPSVSPSEVNFSKAICACGPQPYEPACHIWICHREVGVLDCDCVTERDGLVCVVERDRLVPDCVTEGDGLVSKCDAETQREGLVSDSVTERDGLCSLRLGI